MLSAIYAIQAAAMQLEAAKREQNEFLEFIRDKDPDTQARLIAAREKRMEAAHKEYIEERRHRELCDAIRSTRPTGIGFFW